MLIIKNVLLKTMISTTYAIKKASVRTRKIHEIIFSIIPIISLALSESSPSACGLA